MSGTRKVRSSYAARVDEEFIKELKKEFDYSTVFGFDLSEKEEVEGVLDLYKNPHKIPGDVLLVLRNFDEVSDDELKKDISIGIKGFWESRSFGVDDPATDIVVTGDDSPAFYCPELQGRVVDLT